MVRICDFVFDYWFLVLVICLLWIVVGIWLRCIGGWFPAYFALLWGCRNIVPGF